MIFADDLLNNKTEVKPNIWLVARPEPGPFWNRLYDAIQVLKGKAEAVKFYEQIIIVTEGSKK